MAREFIRLKVGTYRRKAFGTVHRPAYPAAAIVAFYGVLELAGEQPEPGRFESERLLRVLLEGRGAGRIYARRVPFLITHGDLVILPDGRLYVDGWDELQTGDYTVADRVARFRERHGNGPANGLGNGPSNGLANEVPPHARTGATSASSSTSPSTSEPPAGARGPLADTLETLTAQLPGPPEDAYGVSEDEVRVFSFLARFGAAIRPDSGYGRRLLGLIERRGVEEVLRHAGIMSKGGKLSDRQWVFGLEDALEAVPSGKEAKVSERAEDEARAHQRRLDATRQKTAAERDALLARGQTA